MNKKIIDPSKQVESKEKAFNSAYYLNLFIMGLIFYLNFQSSPLLKWGYLLQIGFTLTTAFLFRFNLSFFFIFSFLFTEGQIRILWEYHPLARLTFDFCLLICILRNLIASNQLFPQKKLPPILVFFIGLHFLWFMIQLFNPQSGSLLGVLATGKIYILPFFLFFLFLLTDWKWSQKRDKQFISLLLFLFIMECLLSIYQAEHKEQSVLAITQYYSHSLQGTFFSGENFRPYGTSFLPGAMAVYFYLALGLFFLHVKSPFQTFLNYCTVALTWFCLFISQIRSAFAKHVVIFISIHILSFLGQRYRFKRTVKFIPVLVFGFIIIPYFIYNMELFFPDIQFKTSFSRISVFSDVDRVKQQRISFSKFVAKSSQILTDAPLGYGLDRGGSGGVLNPYSKHKMATTFWHYDNLFLSVIIEMGIGSVFFFFIIFFIPLYLLNLSLNALKNMDFDSAGPILVCFSALFVILVGNWGAVGILYTPESFFYWLYAARGLSYRSHFPP